MKKVDLQLISKFQSQGLFSVRKIQLADRDTPKTLTNKMSEDESNRRLEMFRRIIRSRNPIVDSGR